MRPLSRAAYGNDHGLVDGGDWTQRSPLACFAGILVFGWGRARAYPDDIVFRAWLALLPPYEGEPFPRDTDEKIVQQEPQRILATIRHGGLALLAYHWDFADAELRPVLDELNTLQGIACCLMEHLEGEPRGDEDLAWQWDRILWIYQDRGLPLPQYGQPRLVVRKKPERVRMMALVMLVTTLATVF